MKKYISLLLSLILIVNLSACSAKTERTHLNNLYYDVKKDWEVEEIDNHDMVNYKFKYKDKDVIVFISANESLLETNSMSDKDYLNFILKQYKVDSISETMSKNENGIEFLYGTKYGNGTDQKYFACFDKKHSYLIIYASTGTIDQKQAESFAWFIKSINFGE